MSFFGRFEMNMKRYIQMIKIFFIRNGYKRAEYLKRIKYFKRQGKNCYFQPYNFGTEPNLISFGENVHVATEVMFVNHDITAMMFKNMDQFEGYKNRYGEITVGDNVFSGARSIILYDVQIGSNVIIGAGSVVSKDVPDGKIVAGIPAKVIGSFEDYKTRICKGRSFDYNGGNNGK